MKIHHRTRDIDLFFAAFLCNTIIGVCHFCIEENSPLLQSMVFLVADRAMFNKNNLYLMDSLSFDYVVAAKLKSMKSEVKKDILSFAESVNKKEFSIMEKTIEGRRLIVNYSRDRAKKNASVRERLVSRLRKQLDDRSQNDPESKKRFVVLSKLNKVQKSIFETLGVNHQEKPYFL